jgi:hypothetical protein
MDSAEPRRYVTMVLTLSRKEVSIILGATLMHWGVPFHFKEKQALTETEQSLLDDLSERIICIRDAAGQERHGEVLSIPVSDEERKLLIEVLSETLSHKGVQAAFR